MNKTLTDTAVKEARASEKEYQKGAGVPGLFLRVRPTGAKDWLFRYMLDGQRRKLSLGNYPATTLKQARDIAREKRELLATGVDPHEARSREQAERVAQKAIKEALPQNLTELFALWQRKELVNRKDKGDEAKRKFDKDVAPTLGKLPLDSIRRAHIMQVIDEVKGRDAPRIAGMILSDLRQMYAFAVEREIVVGDPTAGINKAKIGGNANERDRVLTDDEIRKLAKALPEVISNSGQCAVWLMLATCCRIGELAGAAWTDVDLKGGVWKLPETKNGKAHTIYLSEFAVAQFEALKVLADKAGEADADRAQWVMPARHSKQSVCPKSLSKQVADRQRGQKASMSRRSPLVDALVLPGGKWVPHDLRRTGATMMGDLGVQPHVIEKCLNHTEESKVKRTYQRQSYEKEMREAWQLLGERLSVLMVEKAVADVVPMKRRKRA